jgi:hypothetical protein
MPLHSHVQVAQQRLRTVQEAIQHTEAFPLTSIRGHIALALIRAALGDALAMTVLFDNRPQPLAGPALTLLRPLTEKLKRASWALAAEDEVVITAYEKDNFPSGRQLVQAIEANNPEHTLFTRLFNATPAMLNGFVHGGSVLIKGYMVDSAIGGQFPEQVLTDVLNYIGDLAVEAGLAAAELLGKHDEASAVRAVQQLETVIR